MQASVRVRQATQRRWGVSQQPTCRKGTRAEGPRSGPWAAGLTDGPNPLAVGDRTVAAWGMGRWADASPWRILRRRGRLGRLTRRQVADELRELERIAGSFGMLDG